MNEPKIPGGYILLSRKIIESEIWDKPPLYLKVWIYILSKAQHKDYKSLERGQTFISIPEIIEACSYKVGYRTEKPTKKQIFGILEWLRNPDEGVGDGNDEGHMIETTKVTHGMLLKVRNYNVYQDPKNYEGNSDNSTKGTTKERRRERQGNNNNKNDKNDKNDKNENTSRSKLKFETSHMELAKILLEEIRSNNPDYKQPNLDKWANDIRLMCERDNRTEEQVEYLIKWTQQHDFWQANILSPAKLRDKFDTLIMQVKQEKNKLNPKVLPFNKRESQYDNYNYGF